MKINFIFAQVLIKELTYYYKRGGVIVESDTGVWFVTVDELGKHLVQVTS